VRQRICKRNGKIHISWRFLPLTSWHHHVKTIMHCTSHSLEWSGPLMLTTFSLPKLTVKCQFVWFLSLALTAETPFGPSHPPLAPPINPYRVSGLKDGRAKPPLVLGGLHIKSWPSPLSSLMCLSPAPARLVFGIDFARPKLRCFGKSRSMVTSIEFWVSGVSIDRDPVAVVLPVVKQPAYHHCAV
jgi:hypothetical protein